MNDINPGYYLLVTVWLAQEAFFIFCCLRFDQSSSKNVKCFSSKLANNNNIKFQCSLVFNLSINVCQILQSNH